MNLPYWTTIFVESTGKVLEPAAAILLFTANATPKPIAVAPATPPIEAPIITPVGVFFARILQPFEH